MKRFLLLFAFFALATPQTVFACTPPLQRLKTDAERKAEEERLKQEFLSKGRNSEAIVHVKALSSSGSAEGKAMVEVLKTFRGKLRRGTVIQLKTIDTGMCGWGEMKRGDRGVIVIDKERPHFFKGFLSEQDLRLYRNEGIIPLEG